MNSYDYVDYDSNANPASASDSHGTSCAGEISMVRSNNWCGVGAAYDSEVAGTAEYRCTPISACEIVYLREILLHGDACVHIQTNRSIKYILVKAQVIVFYVLFAVSIIIDTALLYLD